MYASPLFTEAESSIGLETKNSNCSAYASPFLFWQRVLKLTSAGLQCSILRHCWHTQQHNFYCDSRISVDCTCIKKKKKTLYVSNAGEFVSLQLCFGLFILCYCNSMEILPELNHNGRAEKPSLHYLGICIVVLLTQIHPQNKLWIWAKKDAVCSGGTSRFQSRVSSFSTIWSCTFCTRGSVVAHIHQLLSISR